MEELMYLPDIPNRGTGPESRAKYRKRAWLLTLGLLLLALVVAPVGATVLASPIEDVVSTFTYTQNMHPMGFSARENTVTPFTANSDIAFWGGFAYHGNYDGFRIVDISSPANPVEVLDYRDCFGNQGDVIVWGNILVRSWNSPAPAGATCDGQPVLPGVFGAWEGLHVFDVSDPTDPDLVASIETECGSHTATGVPDLANDRLLVYNSPSSGLCPGIDIVEVPLSDPADASYLRFEPSGRSCHDTGVILGDVKRAACAGGNGFTVWSLDAADGGSLEDPMQLYSRTVTGVTIGHSASFTWDGEVLIFGHEPGGGAGARCQATSSVTDRSLFFFEASTGTLLGTILHPRPQTNLENCTWHNYNIVPTDKRYVFVSGNYQSGISVVDFTDPANAYEAAYADPAPLVPTALGGDWSTYWYDGRIYESDITRGLIVWNLSDNVVAGAMRFGHLNPQTQETSFPFKGTAFGLNKAAADQQGVVVLGESAPDDVSGGTGTGEGFSDGDN
ncbi:MAG: LVIVD repeat-containing protein [Anaerolineales bacterium]